MEHYKFLFILIIYTLLSFSFSKKQETDKMNLKKEVIQSLHQFLEEPENDTDIEESNSTIPENDSDTEESNSTIPEWENEEEDMEAKKEEFINDEEETDESEEEQIDYNNNDSTDNSKVNIKCLWANKYNVYSLQKIQDKNYDYEKSISDNETVIFNFCQNTNTKKELESTVLWKKNNEYIKIAGSIDGKSEINKWNEINDDTGDKGLFITLAEGEECKGGVNHQTYIRIVCDDNMEKDKLLESTELFGFNENSCSHKINIKSIYGCTLTDLYLLKKILNKYWYIFSFVLIGVGIFLCLFGHKIVWLTTIIVSGLFFCFIISIIILNFIPSLIKTETSLWILLSVGLIIGAIVGVIFTKKTKLFSCLLGVSMGYTFSLFFYQILQNFIEWNPQILYYITIGVCVIIGALICIFLYNSALIIGTTILGGYIAMRGVTFIFGEYLDEGQFVDLVQNGEFEQLKEIRSGWTFAYLGLWLVLIVGGICFQCKKYKQSITK